MRTLVAATLLLATAACASASRAGPADPACGEAWTRSTRLLGDALEEYFAGMRRYAAARDGADTSPAEARTRASAASWEAARRGGFEAACRAWPRETLACVTGARSAPALGDCGPDLADLVTSFTDEVVGEFARSPLR